MNDEVEDVLGIKLSEIQEEVLEVYQWIIGLGSYVCNFAAVLETNFVKVKFLFLCGKVCV